MTLRFKFNKCLDEMTRFHTNTSTLVLKRAWDSWDPNLYLKENKDTLQRDNQNTGKWLTGLSGTLTW